jgi:Ca2+-binding RTX toxin-like protein
VSSSGSGRLRLEGDDIVDGGARHDFVHAGRGADKLFGWAGNDTLFADDMFPDTLAGGTGDADTAVIDRFDVVGECEVVR